ncbi:hypothetical protein CS063_08320 [Sporanaerobium hydrogeniformans]|uniref:Uncharacterized protein n=1 Tax=Sporanaerobium hydrogeniformans TaxID=3072179 RepID=A0AC61DDE3_9FIRM|nr:DUF2752 domain-containing protein [Sporanaerobium hydrogeniformans]PHV70763.1 hypothetical protein CS063_08320 [Sporanaerobium hydrogeniformans]
MKTKWQIFKMGFISLNSIAMLAMMYGVSRYSHFRTSCILDALGQPCWGCNSLAALKVLVRGKWLKAFELNPLIFIWVLLLGSLGVNELYHRSKDYITQRSSLSWLDKLIKTMFKGIKD